MEFIELLKALLLGVVEGITEWLPISSTGHMLLVDEFVKMNVSAGFKEMFLVVIQLGAILAVCIIYWQKLFPFDTKHGYALRKETLTLWGKVIIAVIPAAAVGLPFDDKLEELFFNYQTVVFTLILYGVLFILLERHNKSKSFAIQNVDDISYRTALGIGMFQVLSLIPGTSRSGSTILGGMILGCARGPAAEFSFFLSIPVMFGASLLKIMKFGLCFTMQEFMILGIGMISAFVVSVITIKFLIKYVQTNDFTMFGYYRIYLGLVVLAYFWLD